MDIEITGRESSLHPMPNGPATWFWVKNMNYWLHMLLSFVQSIISARSWEELPILPWSLRQVRRRKRAVALPPYCPAEGGCIATGTCCPLKHQWGAWAGGVPFAPHRWGQCLQGPAAEAPLLPRASCTSAPSALAHGRQFPSACLSSHPSFYYLAFSYLCPLLKANLFILESLSFLCPSLHLLANLFHLFSA